MFFISPLFLIYLVIGMGGVLILFVIIKFLSDVYVQKKIEDELFDKGKVIKQKKSKDQK